MNILEQTKSKMEAALEHLKNDLKTIRTNRANPAMLDSVMVEVYGSPMRLKEVANVTAPESRLLLVTPFDPSTINTISKAINNHGLSAAVYGNSINVKIPQMDEAMRKEMVKHSRKKTEDGKITFRNIRRDSNDAAKKLKTAGEMAEDLFKKLEKQIQELTDKYCEEAEKLAKTKEQEITAI